MWADQGHLIRHILQLWTLHAIFIHYRLFQMFRPQNCQQYLALAQLCLGRRQNQQLISLGNSLVQEHEVDPRIQKKHRVHLH